jgi:PPK2 family polyphosphate:nucleotide phosphotransferase
VGSIDLNTNKLKIREGEKVHLDDFDTEYRGRLDKEKGLEEFSRLLEALGEQQELLYADSGKALLVILQAMDCAGKDSTIRNVFGPLNPQGCSVASFKAPTATELAHDFLWRVHANAPRRGSIGIFNRSHYEDVLIVKVKKLAHPRTIEKRYGHINAFERLLTDEGTRILKFFIHVSKGYQKARLERRLSNEKKQWKFNPGDLPERARWSDYMDAYEDALSECSTGHAPWYVIPGETKWFRNLAIAKIVSDTLKDMDLHYPKLDYDPQSIVIG